MVESLIIRVLARLVALGNLTGCFILMLIANIGVPTFTSGPWTQYSVTNFDDGGVLQLGIWGACYQPANGAKQCTKSSVGYNFSPSNLPGYSVNPGTANVNVVMKPLSESLIFVPLATGATGLALLLVLLPIRIVTLLCIGAIFLAIGATGISFVLAILTFAQANARLGLLFNPTNSVHPQIGYATWFLLGVTVAECGAMIQMIVALSPKKKKDQPMRDYGDPIGAREKSNGVDYGYRNKPSSHHSRSTRPVYDAYDDDVERNGDLGRRSSRRSHVSERSRRSARRHSYDDEDEPRSSRRERPSSRSGSRSRVARATDDYEDDYSPGY